MLKSKICEWVTRSPIELSWTANNNILQKAKGYLVICLWLRCFSSFHPLDVDSHSPAQAFPSQNHLRFVQVGVIKIVMVILMWRWGRILLAIQMVVGTGQATKTDKKFQLAFDPSPLFFRKRLKKTSQELRMLSPSLSIQRSQCNCPYWCSQLSEM